MEIIQRGLNEIMKDEALDELLEASRKLCRYKMYARNVKLPVYVDKQDVEQDVMLKVFKAYKRFDPTKASADTYFNRVIDNAIVDHVRNSWNQITGQGFSSTADKVNIQTYEQLANTYADEHIEGFNKRSSERIEQQTASISSKTETDFLFSELLSDLEDTLTAREKQIFVLRYEGYTHEEIAEKLNVSRPTVAKDWRRIRKIILDWIY